MALVWQLSQIARGRGEGKKEDKYDTLWGIGRIYVISLMLNVVRKSDCAPRCRGGEVRSWYKWIWRRLEIRTWGAKKNGQQKPSRSNMNEHKFPPFTEGIQDQSETLRSFISELFGSRSRLHRHVNDNEASSRTTWAEISQKRRRRAWRSSKCEPFPSTRKISTGSQCRNRAAKSCGKWTTSHLLCRTDLADMCEQSSTVRQSTEAII